jgi:2-hydroxychromene-2-carboxylate isomerase
MEHGNVVEFWFDFASTYSHLAAARIETVAAARGVRVRWRPFLLGPIFAAQGWNDSPFNLQETKGRYMWRDLAREAERLGIPFRKPSVFPRKSVRAARLAIVGADEGWVAPFARRVFEANFVHDRDIDAMDVLAPILRDLGLDADDVFARAESPDSKPRLRAATDRAKELGVFGAPAMLVGTELFWGNDRLEQAVEWAARR